MIGGERRVREERKKNKLRRKEELAQRDFDMRESTIEAAEEEEIAEMENEVRKRE